jgi:hypothetical protein
MRLALFVVLAACGGDSAGPTTPVTPTTPPVQSGPVAEPKPDVQLPALAAATGSCGGFDKLGRDTLDVVESRLLVAAPKGAADIPKSYDIMGAPEPTTHESRVIVENKHGGKFVVFARELWQVSSADLATRATGYFQATLRGTAVDVGKIDADPALVAIGAKPTTPDKDPDAILLLATLVRVADGSLLSVNYYVNPPAFGDGCQALAIDLARGMKPGKRNLDRKGGKRTLGNQVDVDVPAGYVVTHQPGPDFDVFYLRKLVALGDYPGYLLVYLGDYADRTVPSGSGTPVSRKGKLAGEAATWEGFTSPHGGTVVATIDLRSHSQLQVAEVATLRGDYLDELDGIAATIRLH